VAEGFQALGELLAGGIDREGAFNEGRLAGAKSVEALAKARIRVDEAQQRLEFKQSAIAAGMEPAQADFLSTTFRAGAGNVLQGSQALSEQFELGVRKSILDEPDIGIGEINRRRSAIAGGGLLDPIQFGPGGELAVELLGPEAGGIDVTQTGAAQISADEALAAKRVEQTLHPERFRSPGTTVNIGDVPLSQQLLGEEGGVSVVPEGFEAESAFGAESFITTGINAVSDFFGAGNLAPAAAQAREVIGNLEVRTKLTMLAIQQGSNRTSKHLLDLMGTYAEKPMSLFRGDDLAVLRLENTIATLRREFERTKTKMDSPGKKTPTRQGDLEDKLFALADIVADYEAVLESINSGNNEKVQAAIAGEVDEEGFTRTAAGSRFRLITTEQ
jgi:hypothetical protein